MNNFGLGGSNGNILLEPNFKTKNNHHSIANYYPRIVNLCCRTEQAFNKMCDWFENNPHRVTDDFLALLADTMRVEPSLNSSGLRFRGIYKAILNYI